MQDRRNANLCSTKYLSNGLSSRERGNSYLIFLIISRLEFETVFDTVSDPDSGPDFDTSTRTHLASTTTY